MSNVDEQKSESQNADENRPRSLSRVNDDLSVGYDEKFENWWWRVEVCVWIILSIALIAGLTGAFGRGLLAEKEVGTNDSAMQIRYERIARYKTPSIMSVHIEPNVFHGNEAYLWLNNAVIDDMGAQRIIPEPLRSMPGVDGIGYIFLVQDVHRPLMLRFAMEPSRPGIFEEEVKIDARHDIFMRALILP